MSKIIPRTTHTVENQTQTMFVCVNDTHIGVILRDKETFKRLDFFELDLSDRATALYIDDFDELLAFVTANDKGCVRSQIPPSENTDNKTVADGEQVGVVESEGEALPNDNDKDVCKTCGYTFTDYYPCACDTCADCGVITKLVGSHTQCFECYQRSKTPNLLETDVKLTESEINALLILVNTELDTDDRIFELSELNAIRNKLLKASENFDLPLLLW